MANNALIQSGAGLLRFKNMLDEIMDTMFLLVDDPATDKKQLTCMVIQKLMSPGEKLPKGILGKLRALDGKVTGDSFWGRFCRYVLYTTWDEDHRERKGKIVQSQLPSRRVQKLVKEVKTNPLQFSEFLPRYVVADGHRLYEFGMKLAKELHSPEMVNEIIAAQLAASPTGKYQFIGGYFAGLKNWNRQTWDTATIQLLTDGNAREIGIAIVLMTGLSRGVLLKLIELFNCGHVSATVFSRLCWQAAADGISDELVDEVLRALIYSSCDDALKVAIQLTAYYYFDKNQPKSCDEALLLRLVTSKMLLCRNTDNMMSYHWKSVVKGFRERFPARDLELLSVILPNLEDSHGYQCRIADEIVQDHPDESWLIVSRLLESDEKDVFWVTAWLGDPFEFGEKRTKGAITHFNPEYVIEWASRNPKKNVSKLLRCLPKTLDEDKGGMLTVKFLEVYGDDEKLSSALVSHFWGGAWSGPESAYRTEQRDRARAWLSNPMSQKVRLWLARYIDALNKDITGAEIREERGF